MTLKGRYKVYAEIFAWVPWTGGVKRQWGYGKRQFSVRLFAISSEALDVRPKLLYSIILSLVAFPLTHNAWTWMTLNGHITLNSVFSVKLSSKLGYLLIRTAPLYLWWDHRETTYIYAYWKFVTCFSGRRLTASMTSTYKQLNKILTPYD